MSTSPVSHISVNRTAQLGVQCGEEEEKEEENSVSSPFRWWTKARTHLPHLHITFPLEAKRQKRELPVISTANNTEKTHRAVCPQRQDHPLSTTQSKQRSPAAETCPGENQISVFTCIRLTLLCLASLRTVQNSFTRVYSCAFLVILVPPFRSCPLSLSLSLAYPSPRFPFGRRCFSGPNSPTPWAAQILKEKTRPSNFRFSVLSQVVGRARTWRLSRAKLKSWIVCPHFAKVAPYSKNGSFREYLLNWELWMRPLTDEERGAPGYWNKGVKGTFQNNKSTIKTHLTAHNDSFVWLYEVRT